MRYNNAPSAWFIPDTSYFILYVSYIKYSAFLVGKCFLPEINIRQYGISGKQPVNG